MSDLGKSFFVSGHLGPPTVRVLPALGTFHPFTDFFPRMHVVVETQEYKRKPSSPYMLLKRFRAPASHGGHGTTDSELAC